MLMKSQAAHLHALTKPMISAPPDNTDCLGRCSGPVSAVWKLLPWELKGGPSKSLVILQHRYVIHLNIVLGSRVKCQIKSLFKYNNGNLDVPLYKWHILFQVTDWRQNICYLVFYEPLVGDKLKSNTWIIYQNWGIGVAWFMSILQQQQQN